MSDVQHWFYGDWINGPGTEHVENCAGCEIERLRRDARLLAEALLRIRKTSPEVRMIAAEHTGEATGSSSS